jgi:hypothetical protein
VFHEASKLHIKSFESCTEIDWQSTSNIKERSEGELIVGIKEWIEKKFGSKKKQDLMKKLYPSSWSRELVINVVRREKEVELIEKEGIKIHRLTDIVYDLGQNVGIVRSATGADLIDLIMMGVRANVR